MMDEITPEQFLESAQTWKPGEDFKGKIEHHLKAAGAPEALVPEFGRAFHACARSTYDYIQYIHELATTKEVDKKNFIPLVAQLVGLVQALQDSGKLYQEAFKKYDGVTRSALTRDEFDTVYYDAIQNIELRILLKKIIDEVEIVLQSFSLVSQDLTGIQCVDLYETSIRFQLFLQYFMSKHKFSSEELWSILFDVYSQVSELEGFSVEPTADQLNDMQQKIQKYKTN
jgi:hypothetical protein